MGKLFYILLFTICPAPALILAWACLNYDTELTIKAFVPPVYGFLILMAIVIKYLASPKRKGKNDGKNETNCSG